MSKIFLSVGVEETHSNSELYLIQHAVRELVILTILGGHTLVQRGIPSLKSLTEGLATYYPNQDYKLEFIPETSTAEDILKSVDGVIFVGGLNQSREDYENLPIGTRILPISITGGFAKELANIQNLTEDEQQTRIFGPLILNFLETLDNISKV